MSAISISPVSTLSESPPSERCPLARHPKPSGVLLIYLLLPTVFHYMFLTSEHIDLSSTVTSSEGSHYCVKSLLLYETDRECLRKGRWITDSIISASLKLFKRDHPDIGGLQPTVLGETLSFTIQRGRFVQVCHFTLTSVFF